METYNGSTYIISVWNPHIYVSLKCIYMGLYQNFNFEPLPLIHILVEGISQFLPFHMLRL